MQPDQVLVSSHRARSFHRPGPDGQAPACLAAAAVGEWRVWPRERAEAWREPCQNQACFGDGGDSTSEKDAWPVATDGGTPEPDREPRAWIVRCRDCGFESGVNQQRQAVRRIARGHEEFQHGGTASVKVEAVEFVADGGEVQEPDEPGGGP